MFIAEAVAQAIAPRHQSKEAPSLGEKRKAVSFEREREKRGRDEEGGYIQATPFTPEVLTDDLPASFRSFTFEYDGTTDPWEHVCRFENTAQLHLLSDGVKCRVFATTLTSAAQQWFGQLPGSSVPTFKRLCSKFLHHFASSRKHQKSTITLFSIK